MSLILQRAAWPDADRMMWDALRKEASESMSEKERTALAEESTQDRIQFFQELIFSIEIVVEENFCEKNCQILKIF